MLETEAVELTYKIQFESVTKNRIDRIDEGGYEGSFRSPRIERFRF